MGRPPCAPLAAETSSDGGVLPPTDPGTAAGEGIGENSESL